MALVEYDANWLALESTCQVFQHDKCSPTLVLPHWLLHELEHALSTPSRAIIFCAALLYLLFGVGIITDRLVGCTEVMSSHKILKEIRLSSGLSRSVKVRVWHPVIAGLTFDVIGTCSPEIFLPIIEMIGHGFRAKDLGPSLILGSGAFHLFIITSVCLFSTQESSGKPIKDLHLFFTTSAFALFGYLWIYLSLLHISPYKIDIWEALITLLLFPLLIVCSWLISERYPSVAYNKFCKIFRMRHVSPTPSIGTVNSSVFASQSSDDFEQSTERKRLANKLKLLQKQYPDQSLEDLVVLAKYATWEEAPKSANYYRLEARKFFSGDSSRRRASREEAAKKIRSKIEESMIQNVGFHLSKVSCLESCGTVEIVVERSGIGCDKVLNVNYHTVPETAKANRNFRPVSSHVTFEPGVTKATIGIEILDDMIYEERAKFFTIKLTHAVLSNPSSLTVPSSEASRTSSQVSELGGDIQPHVHFTSNECNVFILDDDHCGVFSFTAADQPVPDNVGTARIKVTRSVGSKCTVAVPYRISAGTAKLHHDFKVDQTEGTLFFHEGEFEKFIDIDIVDKDRFGEFYNFYIELLPPKRSKASDSSLRSTSSIAMPKIAYPALTQIGICETEEVKQALDRLMRTPEIPRHVVRSTWRDQIKDSFKLYREEADPYKSSNRQYYYYLLLAKAITLHVLAFPWKFLVSLLPPARLMHGYLAYLLLLALMAVVAALIGDFASQFACTIEMKETVTAITLIPLGMALPDMFASRYAAMNEKYADAAIGGIMGANAVSVFLGLGLSWTFGVTHLGGSELTMSATHFAFSVIIFFVAGAIGIVVLLLRRLPPIRGELGGPNIPKYLTAILFLMLWIFFVSISILQSYGIIYDFLHQTGPQV